jgi:hypothetical protein
MSVEKYTQGKLVILLKSDVQNIPDSYVYMNGINQQWQNRAQNKAIK